MKTKVVQRVPRIIFHVFLSHSFTEMLKPASAASIAGVKKLKVGVKFWQLAFIFGGLPFLTVGFSFSQGVLNFYYV